MGGISVLFLMSILSFMFFIFVTIFLATILYAVMTYIFESISIMCICKNLQYKAPFTAWIPFYNKYLLGKISGNKILGVILAITNIATFFMGIYCYSLSTFSPISFGVFLVCMLLGFILDIVISHKIYKNVTNKYADILTILSVLSLGILRPIILFVIRNKINEIMDIKKANH